MTRYTLTNKLKKIGFKFTQPEFCTKDKFVIVLDCYPYLIESGKNKSLFFTKWHELIKFYSEHK